MEEKIREALKTELSAPETVNRKILAELGTRLPERAGDLSGMPETRQEGAVSARGRIVIPERKEDIGSPEQKRIRRQDREEREMKRHGLAAALAFCGLLLIASAVTLLLKPRQKAVNAEQESETSAESTETEMEEVHYTEMSEETEASEETEQAEKDVMPVGEVIDMPIPDTFIGSFSGTLIAQDCSRREPFDGREGAETRLWNGGKIDFTYRLQMSTDVKEPEGKLRILINGIPAEITDENGQAGTALTATLKSEGETEIRFSVEPPEDLKCFKLSLLLQIRDSYFLDQEMIFAKDSVRDFHIDTDPVETVSIDAAEAEKDQGPFVSFWLLNHQDESGEERLPEFNQAFCVGREDSVILEAWAGTPGRYRLLFLVNGEFQPLLLGGVPRTYVDYEQTGDSLLKLPLSAADLPEGGVHIQMIPVSLDSERFMIVPMAGYLEVVSTETEETYADDEN